MHPAFAHCILAEAVPWLPRLGLILLGVVLFMVAIRLMGEWLAHTHPAPVAPVPAPVPEVRPDPAHPENVPDVLPAVAFQVGIAPDVVAAVRAAVAMVTPAAHRIVRIVPAHAAGPSVEHMMQVWSMEGRRQIYSSHNPR